MFRPARTTPRPTVQGPQTAVVVGPTGEEIYVDKHGRVKVHFFWDRLGKKDENDSCWIRVSQNWAGKNWALVFHPRIGQEVVVDFLEGDPDRPLITGLVSTPCRRRPTICRLTRRRAASRRAAPRAAAPRTSTSCVSRTKRIRKISCSHAQKDFHRDVENDDDLKVMHDQTIEIKNNRTETVKEGDEKVTIEKGARTVTVQTGDDTHNVNKGNRTVTVDAGNDAHNVKQATRPS